MSAVAFALLFALAVGAGAQYVNQFDQPVLYACHGGQVLREVHSVHSNGAEDRRWRFRCGAAPSGASLTNCFWTNDYVNNWDEPVSFMCPANYAISGVQSYHSNGAEDRRTKFKCCSAATFKTYSCSITGFLNAYDHPLNYDVANNKVIVGWVSVHSNRAEDRRHKIIACNYGRLVAAN